MMSRRQRSYLGDVEACMSHPVPRLRRSPAGLLHLLAASAALVAAVCLDTHAANALDAAAGKSGWCVQTSDSGAAPSCVYDDVVTCTVAAIRAGGICKTSETVAAEAAEASRHRAAPSPRQSAPSTAPPQQSEQPAAPPRRSAPPTAPSRASAQSTAPHHESESSLSKPQREKLFRDFVEWSRRHSEQ